MREAFTESGHSCADYLLYLGTREVRVNVADFVGTAFSGCSGSYQKAPAPTTTPSFSTSALSLTFSRS